jgi:agmatine deiminase
MSERGIVRLPAEWEPQAAVQLTWPHANSDWAQTLHDVEPCFDAIATTISRYQHVIIACASPNYVEKRLNVAGAVMERVRAYKADTNDTWARDHGPITVERDGALALLDFGFNGWGGKYPAELDDALTTALFAQKAFGDIALESVPVVLEGGSIESDGQGTILTTASCMLNVNRNGETTAPEAEFVLREHLGAQRVLWVNHGHLEGDDTDGHIDTLARFCDANTIAYVACTNKRDKHYPPLKRMEEELRAMRSPSGKPYTLVPLPWPKACYDPEKNRLPATYANFLIINGAVLVPTYADSADEKALEIIGGCFPGREIAGIDCRPLIVQHGSLHCVTMQIPAGVHV